MENIVEHYRSIPIYKDGYSYYIECKDMNDVKHRIYSYYRSALKAKITRSLLHDDLKLNGEYVYIYF